MTATPPLAGFQRTYLRGLAHHLAPTVLIGARGLSPEVLNAIERELSLRELLKVRFVDLKDKQAKKEICAAIAGAAGCHWVGLIGHTALFYRQAKEAERRRIRIPVRPPDGSRAAG